MNNKINILLTNQTNERKELALEILKETTEALDLLGHRELLNTKEIVKEVKIVEQIEVEKIVEKRVLSKARKQDKDKIAQLEEKVKELESALKLKEEMIVKLTKTPVANPKTEIEPKLPASIILNNDLEVIKNATGWIFGKYKNVLFQTSKKIAGTMVFDVNHYDLADEIEDQLIKHRMLSSKNRSEKDPFRITSNVGACHRSEENVYTGFVAKNNTKYCFAWRIKDNNAPSVITMNKRLKNANRKYEKCNDTVIIDSIRSLIEEHQKKEEEYTQELNQKNSAMISNVAPEMTLEDEEKVLAEMFARKNQSSTQQPVKPTFKLGGTKQQKINEAETEENDSIVLNGVTFDLKFD